MFNLRTIQLMTTRMGVTNEDFKSDSVRLSGPDYLRSRPEFWPLNRNFADKKIKVKVPVEELSKRYREKFDVGETWMTIAKLEAVVLQDQTVNRMAASRDDESMGPENPDNPIRKLMEDGFITNSWTKLLKKTGISFRCFKQLTVRQGGIPFTQRQKAVNFWIKVAAPETRKALEEGKLKRPTLWEHDGLIVISGRAETRFKHYYQVNHLHVIMSNTRVAFLIMLHAKVGDYRLGRVIAAEVDED